jgi:uncharacterized protein YbaR (Trm112 family)
MERTRISSQKSFGEPREGEYEERFGNEKSHCVLQTKSISLFFAMNRQGEPKAFDRFRALQEILCCPETRTPLRLVGIEELRSSLTDGGNEKVPPGTIAAFIADARQRAYPVSERVANFLEDASLPVRTASSETASGSSSTPESPVDEVKQTVREWYDRFGWQTNQQGCYNDTASFSSLTSASGSDTSGGDAGRTRFVCVDVTPVDSRSCSRRRVCP